MERSKSISNKNLPDYEKNLRRQALMMVALFVWVLIWALVFKLCNKEILTRNYYNMIEMSTFERIMWDIIPFNYRGTDYWKGQQILTTVFNCFVFVPLSIALCCVFKKKKVLFTTLICFFLILFIELLQLFTLLGNFATEDFITNMVGCFIGVGIYYLLFLRCSVKISGIIFLVTNIFLVAAVVFSIVTYIAEMEIILKILTKSL